jgi:ATP-dependent protease ClpP protease subunit
MTIHPIRLNGVVLGVEQTLDYFNKMEQRVSRFVCDNSKIKPERFRELMKKTDELVLDMGTVLSGEEAVKEGIIDFVGNLSTAISGICEQISLREN